VLARRDHLDSRQVSADIVTMISKTSSRIAGPSVSSPSLPPTLPTPAGRPALHARSIRRSMPVRPRLLLHRPELWTPG